MIHNIETKSRRLAFSLLILALAYTSALGLAESAVPELPDFTASDWSAYRVDRLYSWTLVCLAISLPTIWWHLIDFFSRIRGRSRRTFALDYLFLFATLLYALFGIILLASRLTEAYFCRGTGRVTDGNGNSGYILCDPPLFYGSNLLLGVPFLLLVALAILKTISFLLTLKKVSQ